jgi:REP element-mobilizing transposase RayT
MAHTYALLYYHIVFSTKHREAFIDEEIEARLHHYLGGIIKKMEGEAIRIGGIEDHVHLLVQLPATLAPANVVRDLKSNSSNWVHETFPKRKNFAWQKGYGAFTVSKSKMPELERYVERQREHHARITFADEYIGLLRKHGIEFDLRFVLD